MINLLDDASLPSDRTGLLAEIEEVKSRQQACLDLIKDLSASENLAEGVCYAKEIHEAKQRKMMLQYQKVLRVNRLNSLSN